MATKPAVDMRGFSCAVSTPDAEVRHQPAGIAVGIDGDGSDRRYAIAIRHADGTTLVAYLSDNLLDRLAHRLGSLVEADQHYDPRLPAAVVLH